MAVKAARTRSDMGQGLSKKGTGLPGDRVRDATMRSARRTWGSSLVTHTGVQKDPREASSDPTSTVARRA